MMERAVVLGHGETISVADLPPIVLGEKPSIENGKFYYRDAVDDFRRSLVVRVLAETHGNRIAAAKTLGLHEKSLIRLIRALKIR